MKTRFNRTLFACLPVLFCLFYQHSIAQATAFDPYVLHQADSIRETLSRQGFIVVKEAAVRMENKAELPVIVPLTKGILYQFVFIADQSSDTYQLRMFDWDENQVAFQERRTGGVEGNIVSYTYVPKISEFHMVKPLQVNMTKKDLPGYVMLLKKIKA